MVVVVSWLLISADINAHGMITHPILRAPDFAGQDGIGHSSTVASFCLAPPYDIVSDSATRAETCSIRATHHSSFDCEFAKLFWGRVR